MNRNPLDPLDRFVALLDAPEPSFARLVKHRQRRRRRRRVAAGAGATTTLAGFVVAMVWVLPVGTHPTRDATQIAVATERDAATSAATTEPASPGPGAAPVEFTACNEGMGEGGITGGREEAVTIPMSDGGEMTVNQGRGYVVHQLVSDVSDPRLDGTWLMTWNEDDYIGPRGAHAASIVTSTWRIETDDGAWQGTETVARLNGNAHEYFASHVVLTGEGAYDGLQAVMVNRDMACPNVRGVIVALGIPEDEATLPVG